MDARHIVLFGALTAAGCLAGCGSSPTTPNPVATVHQAVGNSSQSASAAPPDSVQALQQRISSYTQGLNQSMNPQPSGDASTLPDGGAPGGKTHDVPPPPAMQNSSVGYLGEVDQTRTNPPTVVPSIPPLNHGPVVNPADPNTPVAIGQVGTPGVVMAPDGGLGQPAPIPASAHVAAPASVVAADNDALAKTLAQRIKDDPRDVSAQLNYELLRFIQNRQVPDLQSLAPLPMEDREMLSALLDGLSNFRGTLDSDNNLLLNDKLRPLLEMGQRLSNQAQLAIPTVALCKRVNGFGVYDPIDPPSFAAGRENQAIVYTEVANFSSQLNEKKQWETKLTQTAVLYTETGLPVWQSKTESLTDVSRNRRHDFFIAKTIKLPAALTIGNYVLKVTVEDSTINRVAESSTSLQIVAQTPVNP